MQKEGPSRELTGGMNKVVIYSRPSRGQTGAKTYKSKINPNPNPNPKRLFSMDVERRADCSDQAAESATSRL
jgi:hypothetical protein